MVHFFLFLAFGTLIVILGNKNSFLLVFNSFNPAFDIFISIFLAILNLPPWSLNCLWDCS